MRDLGIELKQLRLHGMAGAWADLVEQGTHPGLDTSRWLIEHLLQAETTDRAMRSVSHQMHTAKFPVHRDLAGRKAPRAAPRAARQCRRRSQDPALPRRD